MKLVDGAAVTMPDTPENQVHYPQPDSQQPGLGFPMIRICFIVSLLTAVVLKANYKAYSGKGTSETTLFREMFDSLQPGDIVVGDRGFCSYLVIALLLAAGVDICTHNNASRLDVGGRVCRYS